MNDVKEVDVTEKRAVVVQEPTNMPTISYTKEQLDLIKRTYAKEATDDELALFVYASKRLNLDIIARQLHFTKRDGKPVFITSIDGYRLNAERTRQYAPGKQPSYDYDKDGKVVSATAYVKKFLVGEWHEIAATAFMSEYKPSDPKAAWMWTKMPHNQLAKCAEALALRRAFPKDLGDTVTEDEMAQVREPEARQPIPDPKPKETPAEAKQDESLEDHASFFVKEVKILKNDPKGKWTLYGICNENGKAYSTLDEKVAERARQSITNDLKVQIGFKKTDKGYLQVVSFTELA